MTYEELAIKLSKMPPARLLDTVMILDEHHGEYYSVFDTSIITDDTDTLDVGHLIMHVS